MALLILFGFIAGAATALSPCVLPVLPVALSAGATGGRRRPLGIVAGLAVSFTFATVALVYVISALGLPDDFLRKLAIVVLLGFGVDADGPAAGGPARGLDEPFAAGAGRQERKGDGFWSGVARRRSASGSSTRPAPGRSWPASSPSPPRSPSPPAGSPSRSATGSARRVVLYLLMLGGRRVVAPLARRGTGAADGDGRGDGRRRAGDARQLRHRASRTRSPATCRASSSTRPRASRTPRGQVGACRV